MHIPNTAGNEESSVLSTQVIKVSFDDWNLIGEKKLIAFLFDDKKLKESYQKTLRHFIEVSSGIDSRRLIDFDSIQLTGAIFHEEKSIRLYTLHLGNELFYIQELERQKHPVVNSEHYKLFLEHVEKAAGMDINRFPSVMEEVATEKQRTQAGLLEKGAREGDSTSKR